MALRVGIVGAGRAGLYRARRLATYEDVKITAVADPSRPARDSLARAFGIKLAVSDHRRLASDHTVDIVYICTPPATHSAIAIDSLQAGKHVICEQPIAVNMAQAEEMMAAAEIAGRRLFVALPQRYDPINQEVAGFIDSDEIGYPFLGIVSYMENDFDRLNDWHDWKGTWEMGGGGVLMHRGLEIMDLLLYFFGEVDAVSSICTRFAIESLNKAEDSCLLGLEFLEDVSAQIIITGAARYSTWPDEYPGTAMRTEILGLEGSIQIAGSEPRLLVVKRGMKRREVPISEIKTDLPTDMDRDFLDCIIQDKEPIVSAENAREALGVVLAGYKSSQMKRRVEMLEQI